MSTTFIFHGIGGSPKENWFPWLKAELEQAGHAVTIPEFPHTDEPKLDEWIAHMEQYRSQIDGNAILVGHSLGSAFALRLLEAWKQPVRATFLVASVWSVMGITFDPFFTTFTVPPYDWKIIRPLAGEIHVINADNDPYISMEKASGLAQNLGVAVELIPGGGHFNAAAGYKEFPALRDAILRL